MVLDGPLSNKKTINQVKVNIEPKVVFKLSYIPLQVTQNKFWKTNATNEENIMWFWTIKWNLDAVIEMETYEPFTPA